MSKKNVLIKSFVERREFSYKQDNVALTFSLRVDNSHELRNFRLCLQEAINDIDDMLKNRKD